MITSQERSGDCSVLTVTGIYWDGIEVVISLEGWPTISTEELAGLYHFSVPPESVDEEKAKKKARQ